MSHDPFRVLIVDDDPLQLKLVESLLRRRGFEVATAETPIGVSNRVREFLPDLVLLDVNMPALAGNHLLPIVRRHAPAKTRFILYSALEEERLSELARSIGADGWISKIGDARRVPERLKAFLETSA